VYFAGLVGLLLILTAEARIGNSSESSFCTESRECLLYDLVCKNDDYETRNATSWTRPSKLPSGDSSNTSPDPTRLVSNIDMTAPVTVKIEEKKRMWQSSVFTLSFLLPDARHESVCEELRWMDDVLTSSVNSMLLKRQLDKVQATYNKDYHYAVGYDIPMKILNRHNEVWYMVEGEPVCPTSS
ncbi:unnamed protein product, partial [Coregonus sp. 'balchen']